MEYTPESFEREISRIHELLEKSHTNVTWNDHIPDPDNPCQLRQIDITIRHGDCLTIIECRLSGKRQNVKWIEELIGRRQSLAAQSIIAVASAGFTAGAQRKAARFGVVLHDLRELSAEEIEKWGNQVTMTLYYYQYSEPLISIGFARESAKEIDMDALKAELRSHEILQSVFVTAGDELDKLKLLARNDDRRVRVKILMIPEQVRLCGEPVAEIGLECRARLVPKSVVSSRVLAYGEPTISCTERQATIEHYELGQTSIVQTNRSIALEVDLSGASLPPLAQFRYLRTEHAEVLDYETFSISHPHEIGVKGPLDCNVYVAERRAIAP